MSDTYYSKMLSSSEMRKNKLFMTKNNNFRLLNAQKKNVEDGCIRRL